MAAASNQPMHLLRAPLRILAAFTLSLALCGGLVGALMGAYSSLVLHAAPFAEGDRLVSASGVSPEGPTGLSGPEVVELDGVFAEACSFRRAGGMKLSANNETTDVFPATVSANFFDTLRLKPVLGSWRSLHPIEYDTTGDIVISWPLWNAVFHRDPSVVGRSVLLDGKPVSILAVAPKQLGLPVSVTVWIPEGAMTKTWPAGDRFVVGRLKPSVSVDAARARAAQLTDTSPLYRGHFLGPLKLKVTSLRDQLSEPVRQPLALLAGGAALVTTAAIANAAGLLLMYGARKRRDRAIETALGASRLRLVRLLVRQVAACALAAWPIAIGLAIAATWIVRATAPGSIPELQTIGISPGVAIAIGALCALAGALAAIAPALRQVREGPDVQVALKGGLRVTPLTRRGGVRVLFLATQVAMSFAVLIPLLLIARSTHNLLSMDLGFEPHSLFVASFESSREASNERFDALVGSLDSDPALEGSAFGDYPPLSGMLEKMRLGVRQQTGTWVTTSLLNHHRVSPSFFQVMRMPLISGRVFTAFDKAATPCVAVVSRLLERGYWSGRSPLGDSVELGVADQQKPELCEIVGVVGDVRDAGLEVAPTPTIYFAAAQRPRHGGVVLTRTRAANAVIALPQIKGTIEGSSLGGSLRTITSVDALAQRWVEAHRFLRTLLTLFALASLLLVATALYSFAGNFVVEQSRQMVVRTALGASPLTMIRHVLSQGAVAIGVGLLAGLGGGGLSSRLVEARLFGVERHDAATFLTVAVAVCLIALFAMAPPAMRATTPNLRLLNED